MSKSEVKKAADLIVANVDVDAMQRIGRATSELSLRDFANAQLKAAESLVHREMSDDQRRRFFLDAAGYYEAIAAEMRQLASEPNLRIVKGGAVE